ncbi:hypothetical protein LS68_000620 [Helicobacter sp. MIT 05-5293]|uniref:hypothetical protein n=1 Tax=Helicobacter sp. MIT 05-5293 TaxID=1548149 RepID=UPI00051DB5AC|nr:hypothetical protein [Helicobacter sp. MIT 05-5293]TLD81573.1 hypothetical protein LS68_000620 [Helicobacter sp. MIT 05-5293]
MNIGLKNWLFPTISFIVFLYAMVLIGIWTYRVDANQSLFSGAKKQGSATTQQQLKDLKQEMEKYVK